MKRHFLVVVIAIMMMLSLTACTSPVQWYNDKTTRIEEVDYFADSSDDKYSFAAEKDIDGKPFKLESVDYTVLEDNTPPSDTLVDLSGEADKFTEGMAFAIENEESQVVSVNTDIIPLSFSQKVDTANMDETVKKEYSDEATNMKTEVTYVLDSVADNEDKWTEAGTFPINIIGYGGPYYNVGNFTISSKDTLNDIKAKSTAILQAEGLATKTNRMSKVEWAGKTYEDKFGNTCRDITVTYESNEAGTVGKYKGNAYRYTVEYIPLSAAPDRYHMQGIAHYKLSSSDILMKVLHILMWVFLAAVVCIVGYLAWLYYQKQQRGKLRTLDGEEFFEDEF